MSNVANLVELPFSNKENQEPLPIPPCPATPATPQSQLCIQNQTLYIVHISTDRAGNNFRITFPHPDKPTHNEINDSDQENIVPPIPEVPHSHAPVQPLGQVHVAIPFTDDIEANHAVVSAITRVQNTIHHNEEYVANIEEVIRITQALQHWGAPSKDDKVAALVAWLNQI